MTTAFYLRLSMADGDLGKDDKDESNSIENQRKLLEAFVNKHEDLSGEVIDYVDDGYTGTNFDRPAFRRMIEDAKKKRFSTILTKDLSRLGRDYIGVGDYIDQVFPTLGIRFIAVNSNYDSDNFVGKTLGLDMTVSNLVNTLYSRDLSKKIRSALHSKWKRGETTCGNPPFGFVRDFEASGTWAVDPEAAKIIRMVFDKALDGCNTLTIANYLNENGIPTPGKYRAMRGTPRGPVKAAESEILWNTAKVGSILHRYEYTGAFVHNKTTKVGVGMKSTRKTEDHERIITDDAHDAIITKEEFYEAQKVFQQQRRPSMRVPEKFLLKGKIRCGNCRLALAHQENLYEPIFYCSHALNTGDASKCCREKYIERDIENAVFQSVQIHLQKLLALHDMKEARKPDEKKGYSNLRRRLIRKREIKQEDLTKLYVSYSDGNMSLTSFSERKEKLSREIKEMDVEIAKLQTERGQETELACRVDDLREMAETLISEEKLTEGMMDKLIEMVYVYDSKHVEVVFKFEDFLQEAVRKYSGEEADDESNEGS